MTRMEQVVRVGLPASTNDTTWAAEHIEIKDSIATIDRNVLESTVQASSVLQP